ncbi:hypothetical protein FRB90_002380 [Tulasnella sp. 427]|nr:hypothetical protein FRB90_002380 [Tulasnella sp. 427]
MERFLHIPATIVEYNESIFSGLMWKERGNDLYRRGLYGEAREAYFNATCLLLLKPQSHNPNRKAAGMDADVRQMVTQTQNLFPNFIDLVACANNIAQTHLIEENYVVTLEWLTEINRMFETLELAAVGPYFKWDPKDKGYESFITEFKMKTLIKQSTVFERLAQIPSWQTYVSNATLSRDALSVIRALKIYLELIMTVLVFKFVVFGRSSASEGETEHPPLEEVSPVVFGMESTTCLEGFMGLTDPTPMAGL